MERDMTMGGNALVSGSQPALMASLENESRLKSQETEGLALSKAVPGLLSTLHSGLMEGVNSRRQAQLGGLQLGMQGRLGSGQYVYKPGWLSQVGQFASGFGSLASGFMGMPGLGGGGGLPSFRGMGSSSFNNIIASTPTPRP